jgi:hypothetical protein
MRLAALFLALFFAPSAIGFAFSGGKANSYEAYYRDTLASLEAMRDPETGLVKDKILLRPDKSAKVLNANTSATNIALDLLVLLSQASSDEAKTKIAKVLGTLEKMPYHHGSGLLFSWYNTRNLHPVSRDVSSVDNIHLALALWTLKTALPGSEIGRRAGKLFARMDFSPFYDEKNGLMKGNLKYSHGKWMPEAYYFSNLGSEARSIYSLCWALELVKKKTQDPERSVASLKAEVYSKNGFRILRTWDGGAFQLMLPELLLGEDEFSPVLARSFSDFARFIVLEGQRQGFPVPAAHSASNYGIEGDNALFPLVPAYEGRAGNPPLVSTEHMEVRLPSSLHEWDLVFTPHAAFLAATADPDGYVPILEKAAGLKHGGYSLYWKGWGFMDGYHVKGPYKGQVVPVQISLDQGMIALSLEKILHGMSPSAKALRSDEKVRSRLAQYYRLLDGKLASLK